MRWSFKILVLLVVVVAACGRTTKKENPEPTGSSFDKSIPDTSRYAVLGSVTLSDSDILEIYNLLDREINRYNESLPEGHELQRIQPIKKYYIQLFPVINPKGEKEVWVNCLCDVHDSNWKENEISVADGGSCYFNCQINLAAKKVFALRANGDV